MQDYFITSGDIKEFKVWLVENEKSKLTVEKYMHDVLVFINHLNGKVLTKSDVIDYK